MGKVIRFPHERRRPHVCLVWDWSFDQYRVEPIGLIAPASPSQWTSDYGEALDCLIAMGERLGLPMVDATPKGRVLA